MDLDFSAGGLDEGLDEGLDAGLEAELDAGLDAVDKSIIARSWPRKWLLLKKDLRGGKRKEK
jgi:hypothetical protein